MKDLKQQILDTQKEFTTQLQNARTPDALETMRVHFLGRQGKIHTYMEHFKTLSLEDKRTLGPLLNEIKKSMQEAYTQKEIELQEQLAQKQEAQQKHFDVTAYHYTPYQGSLHVCTQVTFALQDIFIGMGYEIIDGPEVETDYYNFEALNIPQDHPARAMHDTFWLDIPGYLLRTHTSPVQIHTMEKRKPPMAIFAPGRVYRNEATDASHDFDFMHGEGLLVDKNVSLAHLLATTQLFLQKFFEKDLEIRVRPGYFPFVEPGIEIDMQCPFCTTGCSACKKTRWIETMGAGLVHPNVLRMSGINPEEYSGFAFGFGLSRLAMIKHGIDDVRLLHSTQLSFLNQF